MNWLFSKFWLTFTLIDDPDEVDISGAFCTVFGLLLNVLGLFTMQQINGVLTIVISLLSISWLSMRIVKEWRGFKPKPGHEPNPS